MKRNIRRLINKCKKRACNMKVMFMWPMHEPATEPPLGVMYLAAYLREHGVEVKIFDLTFSDWNHYEKELKRFNPEIVFISVNSFIAKSGFEAAKLAKEWNRNVLVCIGGPHATALPEETIKNPHMDILVYGEGEQTSLDICRYMEGKTQLKKLRGIYYKRGKGIKFTGVREFIENLDKIPFPARDLLPSIKEYIHLMLPKRLLSPNVTLRWQVPPYTIIMASRGCPFNCAFCQPVLRKIFGNKVRWRSPANVAEELELIIDKYKCRSVFFRDSMLNVNTKFIKGFTHEIKERGVDIDWTAYSRVDTLTTENAKLMKRGGCSCLEFGVESGNQKILNTLQKGTTIKQIENAFRITKEYRLLSLAFFMLGNPGETRESLQDSVRIIKRVRPDFIATNFTTPWPGSKLYDDIIREMPQLARSLSGGLSKTPVIPTSISKEEIVGFAEEMHRIHREGLYRTILSRQPYVKQTIKRHCSLIRTRPIAYDPFKLMPKLTRGIRC